MKEELARLGMLALLLNRAAAVEEESAAFDALDAALELSGQAEFLRIDALYHAVLAQLASRFAA